MPQATSLNVKNIFRFTNAPEGLVGAIAHLNKKKKSTVAEIFTNQPQPLLQHHEQTRNPVIEKSKERGDLDPQFDSEGSFNPSQTINAISKQRPLTTSKRGAGTGTIKPVPERSSTKKNPRQPQQEAAVMDDQVSTPGVGEISPSRNPQFTNDGPKKLVEAAAEITPSAPAQIEKANQPPPARVQSEAYKATNEIAKMTTAARTKKKVQSRKAWTDLETETLINLIQDHGTSWKVLKDKDLEKVLLDRDQTSLKDKARNIKLDYLKWVISLSLSLRLYTRNSQKISKKKKQIKKMEIDET